MLSSLYYGLFLALYLVPVGGVALAGSRPSGTPASRAGGGRCARGVAGGAGDLRVHREQGDGWGSRRSCGAVLQRGRARLPQAAFPQSAVRAMVRRWTSRAPAVPARHARRPCSDGALAALVGGSHRVHARAGRRGGRIVRVERRVLPVAVHVRRAVPRTSGAGAVQHPRRPHVVVAGRLRRRAHPRTMAPAAHRADRRDARPHHARSDAADAARARVAKPAAHLREHLRRTDRGARRIPDADSPVGYFFDTRYLYFSTFHWHPIVNGNSGYFPKSYEELTERERDFPSDSAVEYLRTRGVDYVAVHGAFIDPGKFQKHRGDARRARRHAAGGGRPVGRQRVEAVSAAR